MDHSRRNLIKYIGLAAGTAIAGAIPGCAASKANSGPAMSSVELKPAQLIEL